MTDDRRQMTEGMRGVPPPRLAGQARHLSRLGGIRHPALRGRFDIYPAKAGFGIRESGFTLIELLTVMAIMLIIMGMAVGAFLDWGRSSGMRGAMLNVKSALVNARQKAITERKKTQFVYGNTNTAEKGAFGYYYYLTMTNKSVGLQGSTNYLPTGIIFGDKLYDEIKGSNYYIAFQLDGTCPDFQDRYLSLVEKKDDGTSVKTNGLTAKLRVYRMTGLAKIIVN